MIDAIQKMTEGLRGRVQLMIGRAILSAISDAGKIQTAQAQLLADEVQDDVERIQEYGFASVPLPGAEGVVVFVGGNRDHGLLIATDDRRYRLVGLEAGEVALYDDLGQKVHLTRSGIVIDGGGLPVTVQNTPSVTFDTPTVTATGNLHVNGNIVADGDIKDHTTKSMAGMRTAYNSHHHSDPQGGTVGTPDTAM